MSEFQRLQQALGPVYDLNTPDATAPHVLVLMPSFSIGESLLSHYQSRLAALEHRFLVGLLMLRMPHARMIYLCSQAPEPAVVDHYLSLLDPALQARDRLLLLVVDDQSPRPIAAKLLDRPDLLDQVSEWIGDDPAFIEPWNVAEAERRLALRLGLPVNGSAPELWPIGFKSAGRKLFREAAVPTPPGVEDLTTVSHAVDAIDDLRATNAGVPAVILKHDDSASGDGNAVITTADLEPPGSSAARRRLRSRVNSLEAWYLDDLAKGFVAECRIVGDQFSSPSAQVEIRPDGSVDVLSTHEQILSDDGQVYLGCRFPAEPAYAPILGEHALAAARLLGQRGARGRVGIDFVTARSGDGPWSAYAIEINLRKPGTTHPYSVLRHLAPGSYDPATGRYTDDTGRAKCYVASDNLVDENWTGIPETHVLAALDRAGLLFDRTARIGVVPHMMSCLAIDGRFGITAVGDSTAQADELQAGTIDAMHDLAAAFG